MGLVSLRRRGCGLENEWFKRFLGRYAPFVPVSAAVIREAAGGGVAFAVVIRDAISQRRSGNIGLRAVVGIPFFRVRGDVDDGMSPVSHGGQHPDDVVGMLLDGVGEIEASATALGTGHDEQVGEPLAVEAKEGFAAFGLPLFAEGHAPSTPDHVERRGSHPIEASGVDQHIERVFGAIVDDASFVDLLDTAGCRVDQVHVGLIERRQILVVERRPLAPVGVIRLEGLGSRWVVDDFIDSSSDLFHDPKVRVELLLHQLGLGEFLAVLFSGLLEIVGFAGQIVLVGLDCGPTGGDL